MRRPHLLALIGAGVLIFLVVSALLARAFSVDGAERSAITTVVRAEARGDARAVASRIEGCSRSVACLGRIVATISPLRRRGSISIIQIQASSGFSLTATTGTARVVWNAGDSLPIVQCLRVHRAGNVLTGMRVELLALSPRIKTDANCPARL